MEDPWKEAARRRLTQPCTEPEEAPRSITEPELHTFINDVPGPCTVSTIHEQMKDPQLRMAHARKGIKRKKQTQPPTAVVSVASGSVSPQVPNPVMQGLNAAGNTKSLVPFFRVVEASTANAATVDPAIARINRHLATTLVAASHEGCGSVLGTC